MQATRQTVLLVEDDDDVRALTAEILQEKGFAVQLAESARFALRQLESGPTPDVIVLDLMMPEMSGWEFRTAQRLSPRAAGIPLVAVSADTSAKARAIDADAFLSKPFQSDELVRTLQRVLTVAKRKQQEAGVITTERLRSLGLVAAGIAHEVNNPLAWIAGNAELLEREMEKLESHVQGTAREILERLRSHSHGIAEGAERIAAVVRGVSAFSRTDERKPSALDVHAILESSLNLVSDELNRRGRLERSYGQLPRVLGSATQLGQVFLDLLINAVSALPEGKPSEHVVRVVTRSSPEGKVFVEISDTGHGIPPELLGRIFDPFFTTKPVGAGMGLGLSIGHRVITEMGGEISVISEPGQGASFRVELPAMVEEPTEEPSGPEDTGYLNLHPRVLVIDDEPLICDLLRAMLADTCRVEALTDPRMALQRVFAEEEFDVILCDLMMPNLTGMDLYDQVKRERPALLNRIVFMTGGTFTDRAHALLEQLGPVQVVFKPFRQEQLEMLIQQCMRSGIDA